MSQCLFQLALSKKEAFSFSFILWKKKKTNRTWFSVVCTLIDNDTRQHSGQNLQWTHSAALRESTLLIRVQKTLNHIRFVNSRRYKVSWDLNWVFSCVSTYLLICPPGGWPTSFFFGGGGDAVSDEQTTVLKRCFMHGCSFAFCALVENVLQNLDESINQAR